MPTAEEITKHHDPDPHVNPWVNGVPIQEDIRLVAYDPAWPATYALLAAEIQKALGPLVLRLDHIGSTAVLGLAAKPVIDIDLAVPDPTDEAAYLPALAPLGYDLVLREPGWHQHRCLRRDEPRVNLHVFAPDCPENIRHRLFRDWLRKHPQDRELYAQAKRAAMAVANQVMDYNLHKQPAIREIYARAFQAAGLV